MTWRIRLVALAVMAVNVALGLGVRALPEPFGVFSQNAGTGLYASMIYIGVFVVAPRTRPLLAGIVAVAFCWLVEFSQLTGIPAELSQRSVMARLVVGSHFDIKDLVWYVVGVVPLALSHHLVQTATTRWRTTASNR